MNPKPGQRTAGFTLLEIIVTLVIVAVASGALMSVFSSTVRTSADPAIQQQAIAIAEAYMEEILLQNFTDPDGSGVEASRSDYDDVRDYHSPAAAAVTDPNGVTPAGLGQYTISITIALAALNTITVGDAAALRIDISVDHPAIDPIQLSAFRADY